MPWPISRCFEITVTMLSGVMRTKSVGVTGIGGGPPGPASAAMAGSRRPIARVRASSASRSSTGSRRLMFSRATVDMSWSL